MHRLFTNITELTTMQLPAEAELFRISNVLDIVRFFDSLGSGVKPFILGGGSNLILSPEIKNRSILKIEIMEKIILNEDESKILVKFGAGENWDNVVAWAVLHGYSGIEALSAIPGTVGATPVQNVGAYGTEIKDVFVSLNAYDTQDKKMVSIYKDDCHFEYRMSIFKGMEKGRYIITDVTLELSKNKPTIPQYKGVLDYFKNKNIDNPSLSEIRDAIIEIRLTKLPNPNVIPNCGSFFENPIIDRKIAEKLKIDFLDMPIWDVPNNTDQVKIPAGWLIEQSGMKGINFGSVGTYEKSALVLINNGGATYEDILNAKNQIIKAVYDKFGITLETEPEFVG